MNWELIQSMNWPVIVFSAFAGWIIGRLVTKNRSLKDKLDRLTKKNPTELDLELATVPQILQELRNRAIPYVMLLPTFDTDTELTGLVVQGGNMPDYAAADLCRAASNMIGKTGEFEEIDDG